MASLACPSKSSLLLLAFAVSAIPVAFVSYLELAKPSTHVFYYRSFGWFRECAKWDEPNRRFLVSRLEGGVAEVRVPPNYSPASAAVLEEATVVRDPDLAGNGSLGLAIDRPRNRLLVAVGDVLGNRYSALAAYDLASWERLFLAQLGGADGEKTLADDVAIDEEGNAYVTDVKGSKIWKVGVDGGLKSVIRSQLFTAPQWYRNLFGLNGIVYHPEGFLLVIHTHSGNLFKIERGAGGDGGEEQVKLVKVEGGPLTFGDGLELLSLSELVVAGNPSGRLVQSSDGWETARVVAKFKGPAHRISTAATVKDGAVYLNHLLGLGYPKKHAIVQAVFTS